jgi:glucose-1-phosphate cytidylyltransferase
MKVVLFCGGQGTRLRDYSSQIPKPLVPVGNTPIVWHIMEYYAAFGHTEFILCLGYKGAAIRSFFADRLGAAGLRRAPAAGRPDPRDWRITMVDTGPTTNIGGRLLCVREYVETEEMFLCNYADVLTDLDLDIMVADFRASGAIGGFTAVTPPYSFHLVTLGEGGGVGAMASLEESGLLMNGGYMILRPEIFDNLFPGEELVVEGFGRLAAQGRLFGYRHDGFWMPMDSFKEKQALDDRLARGDAPWQVRQARGGDAEPAVA